MIDKNQTSLDPSDWNEFREQSHRMLDDILDYVQSIRTRPTWQPIPANIRNNFKQPLPHTSRELKEVHERFMQDILPYAIGNTHPGFMGWVHGGGNVVGMLADMLCAGLNTNLGGRNQIPVDVERQVLLWVCELFQYPKTASGLVVTGTSMANLIGLLVAKSKAIGTNVRHTGLANSAKKLTAYASSATHRCIAQAMDIAGIGIDALHNIPVNNNYQIDITALQQQITQDREVGFTPFLIIGNAGTVDTGAIDDLNALADIATKENIWFHIDGAFGALGMLSKEIAPRLQGIERSDSIGFDFHKWAQVPYEAGFIVVRDHQLHYDTFAAPAAYLQRGDQGMSAGSPWPCDFGPDLSRSFKALKIWFTLSVYGADKLGEVISHTCTLAQYMKQQIEKNPMLELLAPVSLNIVCFRYKTMDSSISSSQFNQLNQLNKLNQLNNDIVIAIQESGLAAPSTTILQEKLAIRAAIVNHRTTRQDIDVLIEAVQKVGATLTKELHSNEC